MRAGRADRTVVSMLGVSEVTSLGEAAIVRIVHCTDARWVDSLRATAEFLLPRRLAVLVVDLHDLAELDDDAARALRGLTRRAAEQGTAVRVIGGRPAVGPDAGGMRLARPA